MVRPFLLHRTKGEVARELPARIETVVSVALSAGERRLYDDVRLAALAQVGDAPGMDERFALLAALTRLRLAACQPRLVDEDSVLPSSKLERLLELVDTVRASGGPGARLLPVREAPGAGARGAGGTRRVHAVPGRADRPGGAAGACGGLPAGGRVTCSSSR
ncbi:hypothetical protein BHS05_04000 [Myxococcus xanthus]|nr:SNF2-related protein [Myxococcus xanthus]QDE95089.1 hypothetical protein BHS05_04000 [Myxococcus xanthus]